MQDNTKRYPGPTHLGNKASHRMFSDPRRQQMKAGARSQTPEPTASVCGLFPKQTHTRKITPCCSHILCSRMSMTGAQGKTWKATQETSHQRNWRWQQPGTGRGGSPPP